MGIQGTLTFPPHAWGFPIRVGLRNAGPFGSGTFHEQHIDRAGHVDVEYAARGYCAKQQLDFSKTAFSLYVNHNEGFNSEWQRYKAMAFDVDASTGGGTFDVPLKDNQPGPGPNPPPAFTTFPHPSVPGVFGFGTSDEWKRYTHEWVSRHCPNCVMEGLGGPQPNMRAFDAMLHDVAVPSGFTVCQMQFSGGGGLKPRLHLPTSDPNHYEGSPSGPYSRVIDIGDFGYKFFHNATSSDEWVRTPPSW